MKTLVLTGGGSGGHITPTLAVAHELKQRQPNLRLVYVIEKGSKFIEVVEKNDAIDHVYTISAGKLRRYHGIAWYQKLIDVPTLYKNGRDALRVLRGIAQSYRILRKEKPLGIFVKGGFVGVPIGLAAHRMGVPFITHDSDSSPGLANRIIGRWAALHATGMPTDFYAYPKGSMLFTGIPLAAEYEAITPAARAAFRTSFQFDQCNSVVTVSGGSQGASNINKSLAHILPELLNRFPKLGVLQIAGEANRAKVMRQYAELLTPDQVERVRVVGFVDDVYRYFGAADVVVTRASATMVAELGTQRQAAIVIPGLLADDHQGRNGRHLAENEAALVLSEKEVQNDPQHLYNAISELLGDEGRRTTMGRNLARLTRPHASQTIADVLLEYFVEGK